MEKMEVNRNFWKGKRVFLTGHTGFKGGWLALWLSGMGAEVYGYSLAPPTEFNFFNACNLQAQLASSFISDMRDPARVAQAMHMARPDIVFHLAAQPLVRYSYSNPIETYAVNVMGTVNLLEAVRQTSSVKAVINITTDKCYENHGHSEPYRETDAMGGHDPYSGSKGCAELVTATYRRSFLSSSGIHVATARAGNVIGGGDWATDRLIPDFLRALDSQQTLVIRSPNSIRPWQHVLEPISGYLLLGEALLVHGSAFAEAWNFGPNLSDSQTVQWIVKHLCDLTPDAKWQLAAGPQPHEAHTLTLDITKARSRLGWQPRWILATALQHILDWHKEWRAGQDMQSVSLKQIREYSIAPSAVAGPS